MASANLLTIIDAHPDHAGEVDALLRQSFPEGGEADLVARLVADKDAVMSLAALKGGKVAGFALFSRMAAPEGTLGLGPLATSPAHRGEGIAAALVRHGLDLARRDGWKGAFVLGEPAYYERFGFTHDLAAPYSTPYQGPYLMGWSADGAPLPRGNGALAYAPAFAALG